MGSSTTYYWKIIARDSKRNEAEGPLWYFTTGEEEEPSPCPATLALKGEKESLNLLRRFRDEVLAKDEQGEKYIQLFYHHAPEVSLLLIKNPELRAKMAQLLRELLPEIKALLEGEEVIFTNEIIEEIESLLDQFATQASPEL